VHALSEGRESPQGVLTDAASEALPLPLEGQRVLVTRPAHQCGTLQAALSEAGAHPIAVPTIRLADPPDLEPLHAAAAALDDFDWVLLTSANAVERLATAVREATGDLASLRRACLAVIGPATREAVRAFGCEPRVMSPVHRGEALADAVLESGACERGTRLLLARAADARRALPDRLRAAGVSVTDVAAYITVAQTASAGPLTRLVAERSLDWITFTAGSAVRAYVAMVGRRTGGARVAAIGPITAQAVRDAGLEAPTVAATYTTAGLVEAMVCASTGREGEVSGTSGRTAEEERDA